ncbi:MAG: class I SAM-dependent methyltransferase [Desulfobacteraceae bacterium]|nr:class I SAM-dependent methyltransferase [Desulfobacteraceae bacterium]MDD3992859.1 class I SAM-dependent methyltransferase [Desulfobacteraceae bacterium]
MDIDPKLIETTRGFLDPAEGKALYEAALAASRRGPCLEIGSYCGKSALFLGSACRRNGQVLFTIDHHRGSEEQQPGQEYFDPDLFDAGQDCIDTLPHLRRTLTAAGLDDTVVPIVAPSHLAARAWATPLALVFIDGGHALETVFCDYTAWAGHLMPGGMLLIHDIFSDPADGGQAPWHVYRMALASGLFDARPQVGSLARLVRRPCGQVPPDLDAMVDRL